MSETEIKPRSEASVEIICKSVLMGREIDVYGTPDEPLFKAKDVAEWIGHTNASKMVADAELGEDDYKMVTLSTLTNSYSALMLTEDGLYEVFMQSRKPIAKQFKKGVKDILKQIRRTGSFTAVPLEKQPKASSLLEDRLKAATWAVGFLNMNESSRLKLAKAVLDPLGLPSPDYVPSKGLMHSATALLKKHGVKMSSAAFNKVLEKFGIIERKTREGRTGKIHKWAWLPDKHSQYGENVVSPECPNQTQIQWYDDRFLDVLDIAGIKY